MLRAKVKQWYKEAVALSQCDDALKTKLKGENARVNFLIDNILGEFKKGDALLAPRGLFVKESTMRTTVYDMTNVLITALELEAKRMYETDLDKAARAAEKSKAEEVENFLSGGTENEYSQEGLVNEEAYVKEAPKG